MTIPEMIDAVEARQLDPSRLADAIRLERGGCLAFVRRGRVYAIDSQGRLIVRVAESVD